MDIIKKLFVVSRPISWLNTAYPFAAGYIILLQTVDTRFLLGTLFFLIPYNLLMYGVNDVFDYESDIRNPRKGGMEGALAAKKMHRPILLASALTTAPLALALLFMGDAPAGAVLLAIIFFVLAYSVPVLRFKERPFVDSLTSSLHFVGPLLYALALAGFPPTAWPFVAAFLLWGMASHAFGAVQDIVPDREGGLASIATVLGAKTTVRFAALLYGISSFILLFQGWLPAVVGIAGFIYLANILPYLSVADADAHRANTAWRRFIYLNFFTGFVITLALIISYAV